VEKNIRGMQHEMMRVGSVQTNLIRVPKTKSGTGFVAIMKELS